MKYEYSSGGVIIFYKKKTPYVLLLKDKKNKWTFPKGTIKKGEDIKGAAVREIAEEVGVRKLKLLISLSPVKYLYKWEGKLITKTVYYHLFQNGGEEKLIPQREEGIMDVKWFKLIKANEIIGYKKTNHIILNEVEKYLQKYTDVA